MQSRNKSRHWALASVIGLAIGASAPGCTLTTNETSSQCHSQADCLARGPEFAGTTCSEERVCVKQSVVARACNTHQECSDRNGGAPFICRKDGRCVSLLTPQCQQVFADKDDLVNDNTVFIGNNILGDASGLASMQTMQLAREEIKKVLGGGLPPARPGGPKRPLAIVTCVTEPIPNTGVGSLPDVELALKHLQDELAVPAMLGPYGTAAVNTWATRAIETNTLEITQNATSYLTNLADNDLIFRSNFPEATTISILPRFLEDFIIPHVYSDAIAAPGDPIRIAVMVDEAFRASAEAAVKVLPPNREFRVFYMGHFSDAVNNPNPVPVAQKAIQDAYAYKPHVVLWATGPDGLPLGFTPFNRTLPASLPVPYQLTLYNAVSVTIVGQLASLNKNLVRQRYFGFDARGLGFNLNDLKALDGTLRTRFPEFSSQPPLFNGTINAVIYDTVYMLSLAVTAIGDQPLTGPNLSKGLRRVADANGGTAVPWGSAGLSPAVAALSRGESLLYTGVSGKILFDKNGDRPGNPFVFCVPPGPSNSPGTQLVESGYALVDGQVVGTVTNCPGF